MPHQVGTRLVKSDFSVHEEYRAGALRRRVGYPATRLEVEAGHVGLISAATVSQHDDTDTVAAKPLQPIGRAVCEMDDIQGVDIG